MEKWEEISAYIDSKRGEMVEKLTALVNLEGHFEERGNVEKAQAWFRRELEAEGFRCWTREVADNCAPLMIAALGEDRPGKPVLFSGHIDTVHHKGSFGGDNPCYVEDGKIYGPGVLDMKGGLIIALYAVKALNSVGYNARPIRFIVVGEEESDHVGNNCNEMLTEESRGCLCCFNMETGKLQNVICTQKKSQFTYYLTVDGVGGHAGNDFLKGRNAVNEACMKILEIIRLTDLKKETTVTTAVIRGGGHTSGIADHCEVVFDVRVTCEEEAQRVMDAMYEIAGRTYIDGTTTKLTYYRAKLLPLKENADSVRFLKLINRAAVEAGLEPFGIIHLGGASDAGNIQAAGIPVVDNCGIRGEYAHNRKEYGIVDSLYDRAKAYADTVLRIEEL